MKILRIAFALIGPVALICASRAIAQATEDTVFASLAARAKADAPILAECEFDCKYKEETWTIRSRSFISSEPMSGGHRRRLFEIKGASVSRLSALFPSGAFLAIANILDPLTLHSQMRDASNQPVPIRVLDGADQQELIMETLPRQTHEGANYSLDSIEKATVFLTISKGRINRIVTRVLRKPSAAGPDAELVLTADVRYRRPKTGQFRHPSGPPVAQHIFQGAWITTRDIAWWPDGKTLACLSSAHKLDRVSIPSGALVETVPTFQPIDQIQFASDGRYLIEHDWEGRRLLFLDAATIAEVKAVPMTDWIDFAFSPDMSRAVVWDPHVEARVVDCFSGQTLCDLPPQTSDIRLNHDGSRVAVLRGDELHILNVATGRDLSTIYSKTEQGGFRLLGGSCCTAFSPDSSIIAIGSMGKANRLSNLFTDEERKGEPVFIYELKTGRLLKKLEGLNGGVRTLEFSPDGSVLAVGDADDKGEAPGDNAAVLLWETKSWTSLGAIAVQRQSAIFKMHVSPDGKYLATVSAYSPSVEVWSVPSAH